MADTASPSGGTEPAPKKPRPTTDAPLSLLTLGDPLGSILAQCDVVSVCRLERTCKALGVRANSHVRKHWDRLDASVPDRFRSSVGNAGKDRFRRYYSAHMVAQKLEPLLERHIVRNKCQGCSAFPDKLCTGIYCEPEDFELFLRLSRKAGNEFHPLEHNQKCEGFVEFRHHVDKYYMTSDGRRSDFPFGGRSIRFRLEDYAPPRLEQALKYMAESENLDFVDNEVKDIVMTLLAVHKETGKIELLTGVVGFNRGFEWDGREGSHLKTNGKFSQSPHKFRVRFDDSTFYVRTTVGKKLHWAWDPQEADTATKKWDTNDGECKVIIDN